MRITRRKVLAATSLLLPQPAWAQAYPTRIIRLICPFAAGGAADASARQLAEALARLLGQPVIVDNRPGGGGTIAAQVVARSAPDGYTLLFGTLGPQIVNPHLMRSLPYDPEKDFTPVSGYKRAPNILVVHHSVPARSVAELLDLARAQPGKLTFASAGVGSSSHLAGELLKFLGKVEITHVPYRGTSAAMVDLLAGTVSMSLDSVSLLLQPAQAGTLRALAVTTPQRTKLAPDLPPLADTLPGFDAAPINYVTAPAGTPASVVKRLNAAIVEILNDANYLARMQALGEEATPSSPEELAKLIAAESARWKIVIEAAKIRVE